MSKISRLLRTRVTLSYIYRYPSVPLLNIKRMSTSRRVFCCVHVTGLRGKATKTLKKRRRLGRVDLRFVGTPQKNAHFGNTLDRLKVIYNNIDQGIREGLPPPNEHTQLSDFIQFFRNRQDHIQAQGMRLAI